MPINISASAINDYLKCSKIIDFRIHNPETAEPNENMILGNIVHYMIEKYWNNEEAGREYVNTNVDIIKFSKTLMTKLNSCVNSFYRNYADLLTKGDLVEHKFKYKLFEDVFMVGKFDRVSDGMIYDWKTGFVTPESISALPQFIIYYDAYHKLFGTRPVAVLYVSLLQGKIVPYVPNDYYIKLIHDEVIPRMVTDIRQGLLYREGMLTGACNMCSFKHHCFKEAGNELENTIPFIESHDD